MPARGVEPDTGSMVGAAPAHAASRRPAPSLASPRSHAAGTPRRGLRPRFGLLVLFLLVGCGLGAGNAGAALAPAATATPAPSPLGRWALELPSRATTALGTLDLGAHGVNALLVDPTKMRPGRAAKTARVARSMQLSLVLELPRSKLRKDGGRAACRAAVRRLRLSAVSTDCAFRTHAPKEALRLARRLGPTRTVLLRLSRPSNVRFLRSASEKRAHILAVVPYPRARRSPATTSLPAELRAAMKIAADHPAIDLALAAAPAMHVRRYAAAVGGMTSQAAAAPRDRTPPTSPVITTVTVTATSATLAWLPSVDDSGRVTYVVYRDGKRVATGIASPTTVTGFSCGTRYRIGVAARDGSGNESAPAVRELFTAVCRVGPDMTPPTMPDSLAVIGQTQTSLTLSWSRSTDNVGVTSYRMFVGAVQIGTSPVTSFTFTGLLCGRSYSLGVAASDAAGNISPLARTSRATAACGAPSDTTPPTTPGSLTVAGRTQTSLTLTWSASSDNVGVAGYSVYNGAIEVAIAAGTGTTLTGLACGTTFTVGVAAFDGAGNRSSTSTVSAATAACAGAPAPGDVYIAETASGAGDGSGCGDARSAGFFNTASNWGVGRVIAPGTTVRLCGTISSTLVAMGSGAVGNPITVVFEPGAKLSQPVCPQSTGCFFTNGKTDLVLDGGTNGIVENTANGTNLANRLPTKQIVATNCRRCVIRNLTVRNAYVHTGTAAEIDQTLMNAIDISGDDWRVHNNVIHDAGWAIISTFACGTGNARLYDNEIYNFDHGWTPRTATTCASWGPFYFYRNHVHDPANWDTSSNTYHHDGVHCFTESGSGASHHTGFFIYKNRFDGDWGDGHTTSPIFLQGNFSGSTQSCSDDTSPVYVFNNVFETTRSYFTNGCAVIVKGDILFANNTCRGSVNPTITASACFGVVSTGRYVNNAFGGCNQLINGSSAPVELNNNAYANCSGSFNCFAIGPSNTWTASFTTYRSAYPSLDANSVFSPVAATGANAAGVGQNLTARCSGELVALCSDINGNPRPASGAWSAGASG